MRGITKLQTMNTHPTLVIMTGFAYALQYVAKIVEFKTIGINQAYLFSFESKLRDRYLNSLMELILKHSDTEEDRWIKWAALQYEKNHIVNREEFFRLCPQYFGIKKRVLPEDTFDYSFLRQEGASLGKDVCEDHPNFFKKIVNVVCTHQSSCAPETSCGIIFVSQE